MSQYPSNSTTAQVAVFAAYSPRADQIIGVIGIFLGIYTLFANALVLTIISKFEKRSNSDLIFLNLAVTDVIGGLDAIFAFIILLAKRQYFDYYILDDIICQLTAITWCILSISTPLMLALSSLGRFLAIFTPYRYESLFTRRHVIVSLVCFWIISSAGGTMHIYKLENTRMEPSWGYCDYRLAEIYNPVEVRIIVVTFFCIPLAVSTIALVVCNSCICVKLLEMRIVTKRRVNKKISVVNGLKSALGPNLAVGNTDAARRITLSEQITEGISDVNPFDCQPKPLLLPVSETDSQLRNSESLDQFFDRQTPEPVGGLERVEGTLESYNLRGESSALQKQISISSILTQMTSLQGRLSAHVSHRRLVKKTSSKSTCSRQQRNRGKRERNIILVTVLFSLNFVLWNCIMLYYYFGYLIQPNTEILRTLSRGNDVTLTYLNGWFYYATFLTSCVNPLIHFVCNGKMRQSLRNLFQSCYNMSNDTAYAFPP